MEENKKGNALYAILGIATLIVAIIGATFAYFSAQATTTGDKVEGGTNDIAASLSLNVERVLFGETASTFNNLVPADLEVSTTGIAKAVNNKCVANDFTGCHLYKITASSDQNLDAADILLQSFKTSDVVDTEAWKFVVFKATETESEVGTEEEPKKEITYAVNSLVTGSTAENFANSAATHPTDDEDSNKGYNIHKNAEGNAAGLTANVNVVYYLLVYLENDNDSIQNPTATEEDQTKDATGTYSGKVVLNAASGNVVASFTSLG